MHWFRITNSIFLLSEPQLIVIFCPFSYPVLRSTYLLFTIPILPNSVFVVSSYFIVTAILFFSYTTFYHLLVCQFRLSIVHYCLLLLKYLLNLLSYTCQFQLFCCPIPESSYTWSICWVEYDYYCLLGVVYNWIKYLYFLSLSHTIVVDSYLILLSGVEVVPSFYHNLLCNWYFWLYCLFLFFQSTWSPFI